MRTATLVAWVLVLGGLACERSATTRDAAVMVNAVAEVRISAEPDVRAGELSPDTQQKLEMLRTRAGLIALLEIPSTAGIRDIQWWVDLVSESTNCRPMRVSCNRTTATTVGVRCWKRGSVQPVDRLSVLLEASDGGVGYRVFAVSPNLSGDSVAPLLSEEDMRRTIRDIRRRFPGQDSALLVLPRESPDDLTAVCRALNLVSEVFPRTLLGAL